MYIESIAFTHVYLTGDGDGKAATIRQVRSSTDASDGLKAKEEHWRGIGFVPETN